MVLRVLRVVSDSQPHIHLISRGYLLGISPFKGLQQEGLNSGPGAASIFPMSIDIFGCCQPKRTLRCVVGHQVIPSIHATLEWRFCKTSHIYINTWNSNDTCFGSNLGLVLRG